MPKASTKQRRAMAQAWTTRNGLRCLYCGTQLRTRRARRKKLPWVTVDHLIPFAHPLGSNLPQNRVPACSRCNGLKGDRCPLEFFASIPAEQRWVSMRAFEDLVANAAIAAIRSDLNACIG